MVILTMKFYDIDYLAKNKITRQAIEVTSPFSGKVMSLKHHPEPFFRFGTLGPGIIVALTSHNILAPFDGTLLHVRNAGTEFILRANNGLNVLLSLAITCTHALTHTHIAQLQGSPITKGQRLAYFDLRKLDSPMLATLILLNGHHLGSFHYSHEHVVAGVDTLLTIIKKEANL